MASFGRVVREGRWLYAGSVEVGVRIRESDTRFGSGDYEDPPEVSEDREERCYYIEWDGAGGGSGCAISAPFETLDEAEAYAMKQSRGTLTWTS